MHYLDRHSVRLKDHNYNDGVYFVTICTADRLCLFGDITNGVMHLNTLGEFAAQNLRSISEHNPYAACPLFVVMPNHIMRYFLLRHVIFQIHRANQVSLLRKIPIYHHDVAHCLLWCADSKLLLHGSPICKI